MIRVNRAPRVRFRAALTRCSHALTRYSAGAYTIPSSSIPVKRSGGAASENRKPCA
jgi:hypothetical protein